MMNTTKKVFVGIEKKLFPANSTELDVVFKIDNVEFINVILKNNM